MNTMKGTLRTGFILVLLLAGIGVVSADIVRNGGFETSGVVPQPPGYLTCPDGILDDWTIGGDHRCNQRALDSC